MELETIIYSNVSKVERKSIKMIPYDVVVEHAIKGFERTALSPVFSVTNK
jgi:hypothetical protein